MIYTMNMPENLHKENKYDDLIFNKYESLMKQYFGDCTTLYTTQTQFVKNYSRYHLSVFDEEFVLKRRNEVFPEVCRKAYELGQKLTGE